MTENGPKPVGPLGAAFAELAGDPPPSGMSAADIIAAAGRNRAGRRNWVIGVAAAVVAIAVVTPIAVSNGSSNTSGSAALEAHSPAAPAAGANSSALTSAAQAQAGAAADGSLPPGKGSIPGGPAPQTAVSSSAAGGSTAAGSGYSAAEPGAAGPGDSAATGCAAIPLSAAQLSIVAADLPGLSAVEVDPNECELADDLTAVGSFETTAPGGSGLLIEVHSQAALDCTGCSVVDGHPGVSYRTEGESIQVYATGSNGTVVLKASLLPGTPSDTLPLADLAELAEDLLPTI